MDTVMDTINVTQMIKSLGAPITMLIVLTLGAIILKTKVSKALEGGIKIAIALTAVGYVSTILTNYFMPSMLSFIKSTGTKLSIIDVGWVPLATITWGTIYTIYFMIILVIINMIMLKYNKTNTLDVDIFNIWQLSFIGLLIMYYSNNNILLATLFVSLLGILKIVNSDLMKPTFNDVANMPEANPTTTTHLVFMINPIIMIFDKIIDKIFPFLDKYDFDASKLNKKIGFWGSKFAIGIYMGLFIGILGRQSINSVISLAFVFGMCLELFSVIGGWFSGAVDPFSQGTANFLSKKLTDRKFNIGIDWPFLASRAEMWAVANILAPIMVLMAVVLPGNETLPLGGIMALGMTPALLVITRGKIIRMIVIGICIMPIFLWSGTAIAEFVTASNEAISRTNLSTMITHSTLDGPVEKFIAILIGKAGSVHTFANILYAIIAVVGYIAIFMWYKKQMTKRNEQYKIDSQSKNDI